MLFWGEENRPFWTGMDDYLNFRRDDFPKPLHKLGDAPAGFAARRGNWVYASLHGEDALFDVQADPAGETNLIDAKPRLAAELEAAAREWMSTLPEPPKWNRESWLGLFE